MKFPAFFVVIIALLVGIVYSLPNLLLLQRARTQGFYFVPLSFAELLYGTQVKEILEGNIFIGDPQFIEHKYTFPPAFPMVPPLILSVLSIISGSLTNAFFMSNFIFPICLFLLLTGLTWTLTKSLSAGFFISLVVLFAYTFSTKIPITLDMLRSFWQTLFLTHVTKPLPFYRIPYPQLSYPLLLGSLYSLYYLSKQKKPLGGARSNSW